MITLCVSCFPIIEDHLVYSHTPLTPCAECGRYDDRRTEGGLVAHLFPNDPRTPRPGAIRLIPVEKGD